MALADFIPSIWSARFTSKLYAARVWGSLTNRNYQGSLSAGGNTVKIPTSSTSIAVGDYTSGTAITAAPDQADGDTEDLVVNQQKFFRFLVDDIQEFQTQPGLMDDAMRESAEQVAIVQDNFLKNFYGTNYAAGRSVEIPGAMHGESEGFAVALINAFIDSKKALTNLNISMSNRWAVVSPTVIAALDKHFTVDGNDGSYTPATSDAAVVNGFGGVLLGFRLLVTTNVVMEDVSSKASERIVLGQGNSHVTMAEQIRSLEVTRPDDMFADLVKGLYVYGAKMIDPYAPRLRYIQYQIGA